MFFNKHILQLILGVCLLGCTSEQGYKGQFQLTVNGAPAATIVISENPSPVVQLAALELQHHIALISGARVPISNGGQFIKGNKIHIGKTAFTEQLGLKEDDFEAQEYQILYNESNLVLFGRDWYPTKDNLAEKGVDILSSKLEDLRQTIDYNKAVHAKENTVNSITLPSIYDDQSSLYATYDFIESALHVRWYGPSEFNVVFNKTSNLSVERQDKRRSPKMKFRNGTGLGGPIIAVQYGNPNNDAIELFHRRLRKGGEKWGANHSLTSFQDRFLRKNASEETLFEEKHDEYFAQGRDGGEHTRQFCYTNKAFIDQLIEDARNYFDGKGVKGRQIAIGDYFAILPLDNDQWCLCENCQTVLSKDKGQFNNEHFSSGTSSNYIFNFINEVAKGVGKTHPQKKIATLAYHGYSYYPDSIHLEPNISVSPCLHNRYYMLPEIRKHELAWYKDWVNKAKAPVYLWNYSCFPTERGNYGFGGVNGTNPWNVFPGFSAHSQYELIKMYHEDNIRGVFLCGVGEQLDYYLAIKHYDDPDLDIDKAFNEFFTLYFGGAAEPMKKFYERIEEIYNDYSLYPERIKGEKHSHQDEEIAWNYLGTDQVMEELGNYISEAKASKLSPVEQKRVKSWEEGVWKYMKEGKEYYLKRVYEIQALQKEKFR